MLDEGYITSYPQTVGNKIRVYYHLEDKGKEYLTKGLEDYYKLYIMILKNQYIVK